MRGLIVAIDGPAGSGKSSVARTVAERMGLVNLNTGSTYRAVALVALRDGISLDDAAALASVGELVDFAVDGVFYKGEPITDDALRSSAVAAASSKVSAHPRLREVLVKRQRLAAESAPGGAIVEGRDIGTVVLPAADLKVFLSASPEERARRRAHQTGREGELDRIREAIDTRDRRDCEREASPLMPAPDAVVLDTTELSLEEVVSRVVYLARERGATGGGWASGTA